MSREAFENIIAGTTLEIEPSYDELAPRSSFPHIAPDSYLWEVAVCLRKDLFTLEDAPTGFADLFDSKHADKSRLLREHRWNIFETMYHRIEDQLDDGAACGPGERYQEAVAKSLVDCLLDIQADAALTTCQAADLEQLSHELAVFYFTESDQNFRALLD